MSFVTGSWGHARVKDYWQSFSPAHNIAPDDPPALVQVGWTRFFANSAT